LPAVAAAFGGAHGGVTRPAHQFTELRLVPALLLAENADFGADDGSLVMRDLIARPQIPLPHPGAAESDSSRSALSSSWATDRNISPAGGRGSRAAGKRETALVAADDAELLTGEPGEPLPRSTAGL
jgi:hypothetical protein